jgi:predicted Fe-Mo cluster-binding NifX family protein
MKLIVPLDSDEGLFSKVSDHFGSAPWFALVETDSGLFEVISNGNQHHAHGECTPAGQFAGMGASAILCNGIGARAAGKLQSLGIEIYMAGLAPTLADALDRYGTGSAVRMQPQQACSGHDCH